MFLVLYTIGMHKHFYKYANSYPSVLSNTISLTPSFMLPTLTPTLQLCQRLVSMCLPPVLSHRLRGNFVFSLHEGQFLI